METTMQADASALFTTDEAAAYLRIAASTLEKRRVTGDGPAYRKLGRRVLYRRADLDTWIDQRLRRSTSEAA